MAEAPPRLAAPPDGLPFFPDLALGRCLGADARPPPGGPARDLWQHACVQCGQHRQPDGEDDRKGGAGVLREASAAAGASALWWSLSAVSCGS